MQKFVITIARGFGSGGKEIGVKLAERLGIPCYEQQADRTSFIVIGKCADYVLRDYCNVASFYIEAPRADCVASIVKKMGVSENEAHRLIEKTDKYRADYYKHYTNGNYWTNPVNYDMTLNSARVGRDRCVDVMENYIKVKFGL